MSVEVLQAPPPGWPEWVDQDDFEVKDGRDPLGLETITTDRIVPRLVPGVLAGSTRARYFSFHLFLLDEFTRRRLTPTRENQSMFFRTREFEYGAVCCGQPARERVLVQREQVPAGAGERNDPVPWAAPMDHA